MTLNPPRRCFPFSRRSCFPSRCRLPIKVTAPAVLNRIRKRLGKTHATYLRRFDELLAAAKEEKEQERERGGSK